MKLVNDDHEIVIIDEAANRKWEAVDIPFAFYHPCPNETNYFMRTNMKTCHTKFYSVRKDIPTDTEFILGRLNGRYVRNSVSAS